MKLSKEVKISLIAILVFAATIWGYNFLKGKNILDPTQQYYILFDRVDGLIESGNVLYQGYKVGNITALEFFPENEDKFRVTIIVEKKLKIPLNSLVQIKQSNPLASTADLEIRFSDTTVFHAPGDTLSAKVSKGIADYIRDYQSKFESIVSGLDSVVLSVNTLLNEDNLEGVDATVRSLKAALGPEGDLMKTLANLSSITGNLENQNKKINRTLDNLQQVSSNLDSADIQATVDEFNQVLISLKDVMTRIESGEGSLGMLLNDTSLYSNLDSTTHYLRILIKDLQENPGRYVQFSVFGKKNDE